MRALLQNNTMRPTRFRLTRGFASLLALLLVITWAAPALALDNIVLADGRVVGEIQSMTRDAVVIKPVGSTENRTIPTEEILSISFNGEPAQLQVVRSQIDQANYANVARTLELDSLALEKQTNERIKSELAFLGAYAAAQNALTGNGDLKEAGQAMQKYVDGNANHWRYYSAVQTLGELYSAVGAADEAVKTFALLSQAPSQGIKLNGMLAQGRALVSAEKYSEAAPLFDQVLAGSKSSQDSIRKLAAEAGKVSCQAHLGQAKEGIETALEIIDETDSENAELFATLYVALGNCYLAEGQNQEALMAFLHVDTLYPSQARYRAEALYHLSKLWGEVGKGERAVQARQALLSTYGDSTWARKTDGQ